MYTCAQEKWGPALAVRLTATALAVRLTATSKRLTDSLLPHHLPIHDCYLITCQYTHSYVHMDVRICIHMHGKSGALYLHMPTCSLLLRHLPIYNYIRICVDTYTYLSV